MMFRKRVLFAVAGLFLFANPLRAQDSPRAGGSSRDSVRSLEIQSGALSLILRDNSDSPRTLSGIDSLKNSAVPGFDAYDPDAIGASAGLNFEHVIGGHRNPANSFTPRHGVYTLFPDRERSSATLVRKSGDSPWALSSTFKYTALPPHYVDFEFACQAMDVKGFGDRGYAVLFFANYMNDVMDPALHFRGIESAGAEEQWIRAEAPSGHQDFNKGGTYRSLHAEDLEYDDDHNFKLNLWSYDYPRFAHPFYYGRAANGMVLILMFNKIWSETDEIRFSLFKFKLPKFQRPAWDFQYVIHRVETEKKYGFKGRMVWKTFISERDCWDEYKLWQKLVSSNQSD